MDKLEHSIRVLDKVLNSELFLGKYPMVKRVEVEKNGRSSINIILIYDETKY